MSSHSWNVCDTDRASEYRRKAEFEAANGETETHFDDQELHRPGMDEFFNCVAEVGQLLPYFRDRR